MPIYEVRSLDVLGNPVDGYEVNDTRRLGEVYLPPGSTYDEGVINALVEKGFLTENAVELLHANELAVEDVDDQIEVQTREVAFSGDNDNDGARFIEMAPDAPPNSAKYRRAQESAERALEEGETLQFDEGYRPWLNLMNLQEYVKGLKPFWSTKFKRFGQFEPIEIVASISPDFLHIQFEVGPGGIGSGSDDEFNWHLADWNRRPTFGFDPITSEEIRPTTDQLAEILVALDHFMETGKRMKMGDAECTECGKLYESGHAGDRKTPICKQCYAEKRRGAR